ncbi:MAG: Kazal domain-containing protein [Deltaproteobacteria bacterium]|nr:Kazal domain-containing protein [Deltaproteobacteria bacterium]
MQRQYRLVLGHALLAVLMFTLTNLAACKPQTKEREHKVPCGGLADYLCPNHMYCELGKDCGGFDAAGFCQIRPITCPNVTQKVCGCDHNTYASACYANARGVSVAKEGECKNKADKQ